MRPYWANIGPVNLELFVIDLDSLELRTCWENCQALASKPSAQTVPISPKNMRSEPVFMATPAPPQWQRKRAHSSANGRETARPYPARSGRQTLGCAHLIRPCLVIPFFLRKHLSTPASTYVNRRHV